MSIADSLADRDVTRIGGAMSIAVSVGPPSLQTTGGGSPPLPPPPSIVDLTG